MTATKKNLNSAERTKLLLFLTTHYSGGKRLPSGLSKSAAEKFGVSQKTVSRVWSRYLRKGPDGAIASARGNCGRKRMEIDMVSLKEIPYEKRGTVRSTAKRLGISKSSAVQ
jgi:DNA-binding transcriptional regulator YhcF (GntR family)